MSRYKYYFENVANRLVHFMQCILSANLKRKKLSNNQGAHGHYYAEMNSVSVLKCFSMLVVYMVSSNPDFMQ